jgi:CheY-like chemotaxis protein
MTTKPTLLIESKVPTRRLLAWPEQRQLRKRLLLADDQPTIRDSLSRLLRRQGYNVVLAENGREAVERAGHESFDLVLLDLSMPEMNGWEALKRLAALKPGLPVVIITAHPHQRPWVEPTGAWALLEKPIEIPLLLSTIHGLTEQAAHSCPANEAGSRPRFKHYVSRPPNLSGLLSRSGINE